MGFGHAGAWIHATNLDDLTKAVESIRQHECVQQAGHTLSSISTYMMTSLGKERTNGNDLHCWCTVSNVTYCDFKPDA